VTPEEYSSALEAVAEDMRKNEIRAECRGTGLARSVYGERGIRAVEISGLMPGESLGVFENSRDRSIPDVFDTLEAAVAEAIAWLTGKG
jgi:hypothetical protein